MNQTMLTSAGMSDYARTHMVAEHVHFPRKAAGEEAGHGGPYRTRYEDSELRTVFRSSDKVDENSVEGPLIHAAQDPVLTAAGSEQEEPLDFSAPRKGPAHPDEMRSNGQSSEPKREVCRRSNGHRPRMSTSSRPQYLAPPKYENVAPLHVGRLPPAYDRTSAPLSMGYDPFPVPNNLYGGLSMYPATIDPHAYAAFKRQCHEAQNFGQRLRRDRPLLLSNLQNGDAMMRPNADDLRPRQQPRKAASPALSSSRSPTRSQAEVHSPIGSPMSIEDNSRLSYNSGSPNGDEDEQRIRSNCNGHQTVRPKKRGRSLPDELKDEAYWERRRKNNEAAKRSRDARRAKEDEVAIRAAFLEQENVKLRVEVSALRNETTKLRCLLYNS